MNEPYDPSRHSLLITLIGHPARDATFKLKAGRHDISPVRILQRDPEWPAPALRTRAQSAPRYRRVRAIASRLPSLSDSVGLTQVRTLADLQCHEQYLWIVRDERRE
jgi:hypothetical protein